MLHAAVAASKLPQKRGTKAQDRVQVSTRAESHCTSLPEAQSPISRLSLANRGPISPKLGLGALIDAVAGLEDLGPAFRYTNSCAGELAQ